MTFIDYLGYFGSFIVIVGFLPQAWKIWYTKSAKDVSFAAYGLLLLGAVTWTIYGLGKQDWPIFLTNVVLMTVQLIILILKIKYNK